MDAALISRNHGRDFYSMHVLSIRPLQTWGTSVSLVGTLGFAIVSTRKSNVHAPERAQGERSLGPRTFCGIIAHILWH